MVNGDIVKFKWMMVVDIDVKYQVVVVVIDLNVFSGVIMYLYVFYNGLLDVLVL